MNVIIVGVIYRWYLLNALTCIKKHAIIILRSQVMVFLLLKTCDRETKLVGLSFISK